MILVALKFFSIKGLVTRTFRKMTSSQTQGQWTNVDSFQSFVWFLELTLKIKVDGCRQ